MENISQPDLNPDASLNPLPEPTPVAAAPDTPPESGHPPSAVDPVIKPAQSPDSSRSTSPARLAANRRNAGRSTGPKTPEGKARACLNALKHGTLARSLLVAGLQFTESPREFKQLCRDYYGSLTPVGPLEEMLVDQIIQAAWRLRRSRTSEAGEIALSVDASEPSRPRRRESPFCAWWEKLGATVDELQETADGNAVLAGWLLRVRERVETDGSLSDAALRIPFDGKPNELTRELESLRRTHATLPPAGVDPAAHRAELKKRLLAELDFRVQRFQSREVRCQKEEVAVAAARLSAAVLPATEKLDKILRYEAAMQKEIYRAMIQLERLQRQRRAGSPPAASSGEFTSKT